MRLLYLPLCSNKNLNGDSSYNTGKKLIRSMVERGWFVHWVLPEIGGESRFRYNHKPDEIEKSQHVMVHRIPVIEDQYMQTSLVPADVLYKLFSQHEGKYHIDAVLSEMPGSSLYVRKLLQHPFVRMATTKSTTVGKTPMLPVFTRDPFTKVQGLHTISNEEEMSEVLGYCSSYNIFLGKNDLDIATEAAKKYLNFAQVKRMHERSVVLPAGTDVDELDRIKGTIDKRDKYTVLVAERLQNGVAMDSLEAMDYVFKRGMNMKAVVSSQTEFNAFTLKNYPTLFEHAELHPGNPRELYLPLAMSCHATITMTGTHSYPQGLMEQLYLGLIAVLPDLPWVDAVLPNYPFKVSRRIPDMVAMLKWIGENYKEAQVKSTDGIPKYIRDNYNSLKMRNNVLDYIEKKTEEMIEVAAVSDGIASVIRELKGTVVTEEQLFTHMRDSTRNKVSYDNSKKTAAFGNYKSMLFRVMKAEGWVDVCDGPYMKWRRIKNV